VLRELRHRDMTCPVDTRKYSVREGSLSDEVTELQLWAWMRDNSQHREGGGGRYMNSDLVFVNTERTSGSHEERRIP